MTAILIFIGIVSGFAVGYMSHAWLAKEYGVSKTIVLGWKTRLSTAMSTDAKATKVHVDAVITDIEKHV